jgi:hypothetical protein
VDIYVAPQFLISALEEVSGQLHAPAALVQCKKRPITNWTRGWVDPRAGTDFMEKPNIFCPSMESNPGRPALSNPDHTRQYWHMGCKFDGALLTVLVMQHRVRSGGRGEEAVSGHLQKNYPRKRHKII